MAHTFAKTLFGRLNYRDHILKFPQEALQKNPQTKTRVIITGNGDKFVVAIGSIINELLAYYSGVSLIGIDEQRMRPLAKSNPTQEQHCREELAVLAAETFNNLRKILKMLNEMFSSGALSPEKELVRRVISESRRLM